MVEQNIDPGLLNALIHLSRTAAKETGWKPILHCVLDCRALWQGCPGARSTRPGHSPWFQLWEPTAAERRALMKAKAILGT